MIFYIVAIPAFFAAAGIVAGIVDLYGWRWL